MIATTASYFDISLREKVEGLVPQEMFWENEEFFRAGFRRTKEAGIIEWTSTFGVLLFIPVVMVGIAALYFWLNYAEMSATARVALLIILAVASFLFVTAIVYSLLGVVALRRIGMADPRRRGGTEVEQRRPC